MPVHARNRYEGEDLIPTRQSLLSRLRDWNDHQSWKVFFDTYWRLIYNAAVRAGLTEAEAQDVVQETLISVSKSLPGFKYDPQKGSFKAWLMHLTGWRIKRQFAKRTPAERHPPREGDDALEAIPDPAGAAVEALWDEEWEKNLVAAAVDRVKHRVDPKHYQIFDYCVLKNMPIPRVMSALNVSRGMVYLVRHRVGKLVKREIECLRAKPL